MPECRSPGERLEGDSWYLSPFYIFPVIEEGMISVEEGRDYGCDRGGDQQRLGAEDLQSTF